MAGACAYISTFFLSPKREKVGKMGGKAGEVLLKVPYKDTPINTTIKNIFNLSRVISSSFNLTFPSLQISTKDPESETRVQIHKVNKYWAVKFNLSPL